MIFALLSSLRTNLNRMKDYTYSNFKIDRRHRNEIEEGLEKHLLDMISTGMSIVSNGEDNQIALPIHISMRCDVEGHAIFVV